MSDSATAGPAEKEAAPLVGGACPIDSSADNFTPEQTISKFLTVLVAPGGVFEIRAPKCLERPGSSFTSTASGYFQHTSIELAARQIVELDRSGRAPNVYVTLNPVNPALLARARNAIKHKAQATTANADIVCRRWLLIDCDPVRPSGISSSAAELADAHVLARAIRDFLTARGWPEPAVAMSGNGVHLLYRIELPTEDDGLVRRVLQALASHFDDEKVKVDTSVDNAARITKVIGTVAAGKGDNMVGVEGVDDRPHRRAALESVPERVSVVPHDLLVELADTAPVKLEAMARPPVRSDNGRSAGTFDRFEHTADGVIGYLQRHGIQVKIIRPDGDGGSILCLEACPVVVDCQSTGDSDIAVLISRTGVIAYKNLHNRGAGLTWSDVRETLEPGYKEWVAKSRLVSNEARAPDGSGVTIDVQAPWELPAPLRRTPYPFPLSDAFPAGTEFARDYVAAIGESYQVPVDLPAAMVLTAAGLALSHAAVVRLGPEWFQPPNQYFAVLMEPGNRKTGPFNEVNGPLLKWEKLEQERLGPLIAENRARIDMLRRRCERLKDLATNKVKPHKASNEPMGRTAELEAIELEKQLAEEAPLEAPQLLSSDATPEELGRLLSVNGERMGVFSDESEAIEIILGRYDSKPNVQLFNKGYDGSPHRSNRVSRTRVMLEHPLLSIGLVVQPEAVRDFLLNRMAKGTGLTARFGWLMPDSLLGRRSIVTPAIPQGLREHWNGALLQLLALGADRDCGALEVLLSVEATALFHDFSAQVEPSLSWSGDFAAFDMQDWGGKLCGRIGRIALVLHGLRAGMQSARAITEPISGETMRSAIAWAPYLIDHARAAMGWLGVDDTVLAARRVLAWIARSSLERFSKQECFTAVRNSRITTATDVDNPLAFLCDLNYLRELGRPQKRGPGRHASPEFGVNPRWDRQVV